MLIQLDALQAQMGEFENRLEEMVEETAEMQRLKTLPGVGVILAATIALEIGDVGRFLSAERLASYAGTTPRVHASREPGAVRTDAAGRESVFEVGVFGSGEFGGGELQTMPGTARE